MAGRQTEIEIRRGKRKRRVSIVANVTNNTSAHTCVVAVIAVVKLTRKNERERSYGCFLFVLPDDKVSTLLFFLLLHHLGAYLSSIIGFTLRLPSDRLPLLCSPPPLQLRPLCLVIYRSTKSHLTTLPLPSLLRSFACFGQRRSSSWQTEEEWKTNAARPGWRHEEVWREAENTTRKWRSTPSHPHPQQQQPSNQLSSALDRSGSEEDSPLPRLFTHCLFGKRCFRRCEERGSKCRRPDKWESERKVDF